MNVKRSARRRIVGIGSAVLAALAISSAGVGTARASDTPPTIFKNVATGGCVDDSFAYGIRAFSCNGTTYQQWVQVDASGNFGFNNRFLRNVATGRCLDDSAAGLRTLNCNYLDYQDWIPNSDIRNRRTGNCLDDSAIGLRMIPCNGLNYQKWDGRYV
jgi:archaellin